MNRETRRVGEIFRQEDFELEFTRTLGWNEGKQCEIRSYEMYVDLECKTNRHSIIRDSG